MRNEENLIKGVNYSVIHTTPPKGPESIVYQDLIALKTLEDINEKSPKKDGESFVFTAKESVVNEYLNERFDYCNIYDFMELYFSLHFDKPFTFPISAQQITCVMRKVSDVDKLATEMKDHQATLLGGTRMGFGAPLNLHDDSVYILTLIECNFDLCQYQTRLPGYYHVTEHYRYKIKSSIQGDLTIFYERIK